MFTISLVWINLQCQHLFCQLGDLGICFSDSIFSTNSLLVLIFVRLCLPNMKASCLIGILTIVMLSLTSRRPPEGGERSHCVTVMSSKKVWPGNSWVCVHQSGCSPAIDKWQTTLNILNRCTPFFSSPFGNGKVYKCSAINEALSALKVTASVDLKVCATLSSWRDILCNCSLYSGGALMVELNPQPGLGSTA